MTTLTSPQSAAVHSLSVALDTFNAGNIFSDMKHNHTQVVAEFRKLEAEFPAEAAYAKEFYFSEEPIDDINGGGREEALFNIFCSLNAFSVAETFIKISHTLTDLSNEIFDLSTYSDEYDDMRAEWRVSAV